MKKLSPFLIYIIVMILITSIVLFILIGSDKSTPKILKYGDRDRKYKLCTTLPCLEINDILYESVDTTVDPCQNFRDFACGKLIKSFEIENSYSTALERIKVEAEIEFADLVSAPITSADSLLSKQAKQCFTACMNPRLTVEYDTHRSLYNEARLFDSPMGNKDWNENTFNWISLYKTLAFKGIGLYSILYVGQTFAPTDFTTKIPEFQKGQIKSLRDGTLRTEKLEFFVKMFNANNIKTTNSLYLDLELAFRVYDDLADLQFRYSDPQQIKRLNELQRKCDDINWLEVVLITFHEKAGINIDSVVSVFDETYLCQLNNQIFKKHSKRAIANFIYLSAFDFIATERTKFQLISNLPDELKRLKCARLVAEIHPIAASYLYIRHKEQTYLTEPASKQLAHLLDVIIRNEVISYVLDSKWTPSTVKYQYLDKLRIATVHKSFIPVKGTLEETIKRFEDDIYKTIPINDQEPVHNQLWVKAANHYDSSLSQNAGFYQFILLHMDSGNGVIANAQYFPNNVQVNHAFINYVTFLHGAPMFHNIGSLGFIVGHEFCHSLITPFENVDKSNRNITIWSKPAKRKLDKRLNCLIKAYSNETDPCSGLKVNGEQVVSESFPDLGGTFASRRALENWLNENSEKRLPALPNFLNYTYEQMYWISKIQTQCSRMKKDSCKYVVETDVHPIDTIRENMNGKMSEYFGKDWNCPIGTPMNPKLKCKVY